MKNTFGESVAVTVFGESHGAAIGAVLDGMAPGILVDEGFLAAQLSLRAARGSISTQRQEADEAKIISGVINGYTTGTPITILIENANTKSSDYDKLKQLPRPGHADYTAQQKYHGFQDARGGGHFSGRITAGLVAAGALAIGALRDKGIFIGTHLLSLAGIDDGPLTSETQVKAVMDKPFPVLDDIQGEKMANAILEARQNKDSVGGILETMVTGVPAGVGEPFFDTVEGCLAKALFAIPGIKGVQFGLGFGLCALRGSQANDALTLQNGQVATLTNHNGGVNGGITNGMPLVFSCAVKPTPSIAKEQQTVNLATGQEEALIITGRHDPAIAHRARAVVNAVTALTLCDLLSLRYGTDYLGGAK